MRNYDIDMMRKYNTAAPYYTSYPVLGRWHDSFDESAYRKSIEDYCSSAKDDPLSIYVHFPFCKKMCFYCICNFVVTHDRQKIKRYLGYLFKEIDMMADIFDNHSFRPRITDIHIGGGTPSYMDNDEVDLLLEKLHRLVPLEDLEEFTIEVDLRTADRGKIEHYHEMGISRLSFGIQDFEPSVQKAINRLQPPDIFEEVFPDIYRDKFLSFNFDLLYGLPFQTRESFRRTIETVKKMAPDRITILKYAHVPHLRKHMRLIKDENLPDPVEAKMMFCEAIDSLTEGGYTHIGIDHFAKDNDSLTIAKGKGLLGRSFNGFNPRKSNDLIGFGTSTTAGFENIYSQSVAELPEYYDLLDNNQFPIQCGYVLNKDEMIRREIINEILCRQVADLSKIGHKYDMDLIKYFEKEIHSFSDLITDGIMVYVNNMISITSIGRVYIQHVCKVFDKNLSEGNVPYKMSGTTRKIKV